MALQSSPSIGAAFGMCSASTELCYLPTDSSVVRGRGWGGSLLILLPSSLSLSPSSPPPSPPKATCALHEIMSAPESGPAVLGLYAPLFVTLLLRVSCTVGVQLPKSLQGRERKSSSSSNAATSRSLQPCRYTGRIGVAVGSRRGTQAGWVDPALLCALGSAGFGFLYACGFLPVLPVVPVLGCPGDAEGPTLCP